MNVGTAVGQTTTSPSEIAPKLKIIQRDKVLI